MKSLLTRLPFINFKFLFLLFCLVATIGAEGQLCNGSLGDPVVNITFNGSGASGLVRSYSYVSTNCPNDGMYTVTNQTSNCFNNTWHTVSDHTGGGNFMLVNASYDPGDFYVDTIGGLCPNTTYEFAAWIVNVINSFGKIRPNLTFRIEKTDGTVLASYDTGDIEANPSSPFWKQYGLYFATPLTEARVVLRITNNAPGGIGNDLGLDDITFRPCGSKIAAQIMGHTDTVHICVGNNTVYTMQADVSADYTNPLYFWQESIDTGKTWTDIPGENTFSFQRLPTGAGVYWYRMAVVETSVAGLKTCRIASNALVINVHAYPIVDAGADRVLIKGNEVILAGSVSGEVVSYEWSPSTAMNDIHNAQPVVAPQNDIRYTLQAFSKYGCNSQDDVFVKVVNDIYVPTAFSPNGDGYNDNWRVPFLDPTLNGEVSLFSRSGKLVYHVKATTVSWDGTVNGQPQPSGVYVYLIKVGKLQFQGTVVLIR